MLTYAILHQAKRARQLAALLDTAEARIEAGHICAANDRNQRPASWWMATLDTYLVEEIEEAAAERDQAIALAELAADAAQEREAIIERLLDAGETRAASHVEHGATWHETQAGIVAQRYGGERHEVRQGRCTCTAGRRGVRCWAVGLSEALEPQTARRAA